MLAGCLPWAEWPLFTLNELRENIWNFSNWKLDFSPNLWAVTGDRDIERKEGVGERETLFPESEIENSKYAQSFLV